MSHAHTINNACLTIFGLHIGGANIDKVISETVAMGMDNDCNAATAGSIAGIVYGKDKLSKHWYHPFNDKIDSYLINTSTFSISDILKRYLVIAKDNIKFN